jgi:UDP-glucose 4-epimerase
MVLPRFLEAARTGGPIRVFGDGSQTRCFCHVRDCVEALLRLRACEAARGEVVNIGHDDEISVLALAELVRRTVGNAVEIERIPYQVAYRSGFQDMPRRRPDVRKLERLVGFRPRADIAEVVRRVAAGE